MFIALRKVSLRRPIAEVHQAVIDGLAPALKQSPGFQNLWLIRCTDGDHALAVLFDSETNARLAGDQVAAWTEKHSRELLVLPPTAMFGGDVEML